MKTRGKAFAVFACVVLMSAVAWGQLVVENFSYTVSEDLANNGWTVLGTNNATNCNVSSSGLSYSGYAGSGIGNGATIVAASSADEVGLGFTSQTSGIVFYSLLVNLSSAPSTASYITGFAPSLAASFPVRLHCQNVSSNLRFGVSKGTSTTAMGTTDFSFSTTYLLVLKYTFNGSTGDDQVDLFVFTDPSLPGSEPGTPEATTTTGTDASAIAAIFLRQDANSGAGTIDGIRVATSWSDAPLPVQFVNFSVMTSRLGAELQWSTSSEINNYGFDIERRTVGSRGWSKIAFVAGAGTSTSPRDYSYVDVNLSPGRYAYRIKQIDNDGTFQYYGNAEVEIGLAAKEFRLESNYPNPFNPSTTIAFTLAEDGKATLKVFNMLGQEVATLFNSEAQAGRLQQVKFDASQLPSGLYFAKLEAGKQQMMRKMVLLR
ncbi:MAG: T9SS type A sorting domain-containing protein [Ignavibacteriales bacterium]|nr:T9SS type A sorting domain-containing protein [Ignavibacteriales bacterium]